MPELPEVETIARGLRAGAVGRTIADARRRRDDRLRPDPESLCDGLIDRTIVGVDRYGKHLFIRLSGEVTLAVHLRMTGQLRLHAAGDEERPHTHLVLDLDDGRELRWRDVRRFGWLHLLPNREVAALPSMTGLGPDALALGEAEFVTRLTGSSRRMKPLLLAQDIVCGLGNIYADEVLHRARIHPRQRADRLSPTRARRLHAVIGEVLREAIEAGGSSIDGEYVAVDGFLGEYQTRHAVYGREGRPAPCCGRPVRRIVLGGRSTFYCSACQIKVGAG